VLEHRGLSLFTVFYGLDGIATVPPTVSLTRRAFGDELGTVVYGWVMASHQVGAGLAALGAGLVRTPRPRHDADGCKVAALARGRN
jgi:hypothetical protein